MTKDTLKRMRQASEEGFALPVGGSGGAGDEGKAGQKGTVEVAFAHNWAWEKDAKARGRFWPGKL